jgi:hypothetical protein
MLYQAICLTLSSSKQLKIITQEMKEKKEVEKRGGGACKNIISCVLMIGFTQVGKEHKLNCKNHHKIAR